MNAFPLADAATFARRSRHTRFAQLALAVAALAAAAVAVAVALRAQPRTSAFVPPGTSALVVLDVSASISSETYARIAATLDELIASDGRYGLVLFSDTAYLALPPGSPAAELRPFARFFRVAERTRGAAPALRRTPWTDSFSAGTRISTGLLRALETIRRERLVEPAVLLVSDLDDDTGDLERLAQVALAYRRASVPLHVVGLAPAPEDEALMRRLLASPGDLQPAKLRFEGDERAAARSIGPFAAAAGALALLLAALAVATGRLRWQARA